jgi:hypothetical protein
MFDGKDKFELIENGKMVFAQKDFPFPKYQKSFGGKKTNLAKKV